MNPDAIKRDLWYHRGRKRAIILLASTEGGRPRLAEKSPSICSTPHNIPTGYTKFQSPSYRGVVYLRVRRTKNVNTFLVFQSPSYRGVVYLSAERNSRPLNEFGFSPLLIGALSICGQRRETSPLPPSGFSPLLIGALSICLWFMCGAVVAPSFSPLLIGALSIWDTRNLSPLMNVWFQSPSYRGVVYLSTTWITWTTTSIVSVPFLSGRCLFARWVSVHDDAVVNVSVPF